MEFYWRQQIINGKSKYQKSFITKFSFSITIHFRIWKGDHQGNIWIYIKNSWISISNNRGRLWLMPDDDLFGDSFQFVFFFLDILCAKWRITKKAQCWKTSQLLIQILTIKLGNCVGTKTFTQLWLVLDFIKKKFLWLWQKFEQQNISIQLVRIILRKSV